MKTTMKRLQVLAALAMGCAVGSVSHGCAGTARASGEVHVVPCDPVKRAAALDLPGRLAADIAVNVHALAHTSQSDVPAFPGATSYVSPIFVGDGLAVVDCHGGDVPSVTFIVDP